MLKLIPQEEPEKNRNQSKKARAKGRRKQTSSKTARAQQPSQKASSKKCVLTNTYKQLLTYTSDPEKHTDREIADIILSMHRSILRLEQTRVEKRKKRKGK